jgi:hypothetical protein
MKEKNYSNIRNSLKLKIDEVTLIFVVPNTRFKFTPKPVDILFDEHINVYLGPKN